MEWRDVAGYEGIYEVSNTGRVRTVEGKTTYTERHGVRRWKQRVLKRKVSKDKSCRVSLWKDGEEKSFLVHRLVALAFIPLEEGRDFINHKDGNRLNNHADNLEWCTYSENINHAFDTGLIKTGKPTVLREISTGKEYRFRSISKACEFLGRSPSFIHYRINIGNLKYKGYEIEVCD